MSRAPLLRSFVTMLKGISAEAVGVTVNPTRVHVTAELRTAAEAAVIVKTPEAKVGLVVVAGVKPSQMAVGSVPRAVN
jgi:hypothetical protein